MRESTFIDRNKAKWQQIEEFVKTNPDDAASDFVEIVTDLSYAQTHYPHSKITSYLNHLAVKTHKPLFRNAKSSPFLKFWKTEFPLILGRNKKVLWISVLFFLSFFSLGVICSYLEPEFIESVMGSEYIQMTEDNIAQGQPFGVYSKEEPLRMFARIFANNLFVGLIVFISGIFIGLGSFFHTFKNGLMIGSFFSIFFKAKLGFSAFLVIGLHGTLEIMTLILETMAGLLLGLSFLFPGTLTRRQAFLKGLKQSANIFVGTIPFILIAAFIEAYITRFGSSGPVSASPLTTAGLFLVFSGSWILLIWYFFIYSSRISRSVSDSEYRNLIIS